jgi:hypothetical protein
MTSKWRFVVWVGVVASLVGIRSDASASSVVAPTRPLTKEDQVVFSVAWAEAICRGRVLSQGISSGHDGNNKRVKKQYLVIQPIEWLKGDGGNRPFKVGTFTEDADLFDRYQNLGDERAEAIFFLQSTPTRPQETMPMWPFPDPETVPWIFYPLEYAAEGGALSVDSANKNQVQATVKAEVLSQAPETMSRNADLVVVARRNPGAEQGGSTASVIVDSTIAGIAPGKTIHITSVSPDDMVNLPAILFLKRKPNNVFEVLKPYAGSLYIKDNHPRGHKDTVAQFAARVRNARKAGVK